MLYNTQVQQYAVEFRFFSLYKIMLVYNFDCKYQLCIYSQQLFYLPTSFIAHMLLKHPRNISIYGITYYLEWDHLSLYSKRTRSPVFRLSRYKGLITCIQFTAHNLKPIICLIILLYICHRQDSYILVSMKPTAFIINRQLLYVVEFFGYSYALCCNR